MSITPYSGNTTKHMSSTALIEADEMFKMMDEAEANRSRRIDILGKSVKFSSDRI